MISVALVGPDGAGKSTISELLRYEHLPAPMRSIYMGVNLEASGLMLPTTRLALALKRASGGRPDMTATSGAARSGERSGDGLTRRTLCAGVRGLRLGLWLAEEWFRQLVALGHRMRGRIVVFDRHFYADYYHYDIVGADRGVGARVHGFLLRNVYPKPDLVICLDAPGDVLYRRKQEASPEWLEQRRHQYLQLERVVPHFAVVNVDRPLSDVARDVAALITDFCEKRST